MSRLIRLLIIVLLPILAALSMYFFLRREFFEPVNAADTSKSLVEIEGNKTFDDICQKIKGQGIVRSCWSLNLLARVKKKDTAIKAGEYELSKSMTPLSILDKLASGDFFKRKVFIREGESIWNIGEHIEKAGLVTKEEFNRALVDPKILVVEGISAQSFEGYLFPQTYFFSRPITVNQIIHTMVKEGDKRWTPQFQRRADELHLSRHDIITLASIIERESGNVDEQPIISSVFHNRINQGMKLQSDPVVIYGIPNFDGNLTRAHLETPSPYNTYLNYGLPPGPIGNPGETAIKAALFPSQTNYLFFVAKDKHSHVFSTTLAEHNEAVRRYQKAPAQAAAQAAAKNGASLAPNDAAVASKPG